MNRFPPFGSNSFKMSKITYFILLIVSFSVQAANKTKTKPQSVSKTVDPVPCVNCEIITDPTLLEPTTPPRLDDFVIIPRAVTVPTTPLPIQVRTTKNLAIRPVCATFLPRAANPTRANRHIRFDPMYKIEAEQNLIRPDLLTVIEPLEISLNSVSVSTTPKIESTTTVATSTSRSSTITTKTSSSKTTLSPLKGKGTKTLATIRSTSSTLKTQILKTSISKNKTSQTVPSKTTSKLKNGKSTITKSTKSTVASKTTISKATRNPLQTKKTKNPKPKTNISLTIRKPRAPSTKVSRSKTTHNTPKVKTTKPSASKKNISAILPAKSRKTRAIKSKSRKRKTRKPRKRKIPAYVRAERLSRDGSSNQDIMKLKDSISDAHLIRLNTEMIENSTRDALDSITTELNLSTTGSSSTQKTQKGKKVKSRPSINPTQISKPSIKKASRKSTVKPKKIQALSKFKKKLVSMASDLFNPTTTQGPSISGKLNETVTKNHLLDTLTSTIKPRRNKRIKSSTTTSQPLINEELNSTTTDLSTTDMTPTDDQLLTNFTIPLKPHSELQTNMVEVYIPKIDIGSSTLNPTKIQMPPPDKSVKKFVDRKGAKNRKPLTGEALEERAKLAEVRLRELKDKRLRGHKHRPLTALEQKLVDMQYAKLDDFSV